MARAKNVAIAGTAAEAPCWLLIEDPSPWRRKAVKAAAWASRVRDSLAAWQDAVPGLRVQLIRRALTRWETPGQIRCFVVRAGPDPCLHTCAVTTYAALSDMDVPGLLRQPSPGPSSDPLVLTCTHGKRDACCAKWGRPVATAVRSCHPEGAWQTSHLGGHRFAPTVLVLPHGAHYGWIRPADVGSLIEAHRSGRVFDLGRYRGRVDLPRPVQAACIALRRRLDLHAVDAVAGHIVEAKGSTWHVAVRTHDDTYRAQVQQRADGPVVRHSCASETPTPSTSLRVTWA